MKRYLTRFLVFVITVLIVFGIFHAGSFICCIAQEKTAEYKLPIIMYHHVLKDVKRQGEYVISPEEFENDLKYIQKEGYTTITDIDLIEYAEKGTALPEKPIMLTFDDGHLSYFEYVVPLLEKYKMKGVVSVVGAYTNDFTLHPDKAVAYAYLSWEEVKKLSLSQHTRIANHTYDMHKLSGGRKGCSQIKGESDEHYRKTFKEDAQKMRDLIYSYTNVHADCFTYPFGYYSGISEEEIKKMGFKMSLSCTEGINYISQDSSLFKMKRCNRPHGKSVEKILGEQ